MEHRLVQYIGNRKNKCNCDSNIFYQAKHAIALTHVHLIAGFVTTIIDDQLIYYPQYTCMIDERDFHQIYSYSNVS